jgi:hypothetical protein
MPSAITRQAALIGVSVGLGLWASGASLDHAAGPSGPIRVAMLPSLWRLLLLVVVGSAATVTLAALFRLVLRRRADGLAADARALDTVRPLAAAGLLVLPYLPWLPDALPALLLLAGPGAWIWWGVLAGQVLAALVVLGDLTPTWSSRDLTPDLPPAVRAHARRWTTAIFLASVLASGVLADRFIRTPLFPGGDEPHYLIVAQSLWRDGDLRIENNHTRRDYDEYFHRDLAPHYLTRGVDREIYSIHPVGMPALMAPIYAAAGYEGVVAALVLLGAIALTLAWRLAWAVTASAGAATFGWATLALGVPWAFNTFSVYPEIPAATAAMVAFAVTSGWRPGVTPVHPPLLRLWRFLVTGVALGALPWFSTKYAVMAAALGLVVMARLWLPWPPDAISRTRAVARSLAVGVPCALSLAGWFLFFKTIWGTYSPAAPYGSQRETRLEYLPQGGPGLLFDQEYGIVLFAPALLMVLPGLWALWRMRAGGRRLALELVAVWVGLLGVVGSFHIWWGGSAIVGRPVVAALPLLVVAVAAQWQASAGAPMRRASQLALLWIGMGLCVMVATAQNGLLLVAGRDGTSQVLSYLAPSSGVWTLLPTFLRQSPGAAALLAALWVLPLLVTGALTARLSRGESDSTAGVPTTRTSPGRAAAVSAFLAVSVVALVSGIAQAVMTPSTPAPDLARRPRVRLLDEFDADRRPLAVRYAPLSRIAAEDVPPLFPLLVNERGAQAVDRATQLFGQRLSLPAGRYGLDVVLPPADAAQAPIAGTLALQVGRTGPAYASWDLDLTAPATWGRAFSLPVDVGFVGLKASPAVAAAGPQVRITPQAIVPASKRPSTRGVLGSGRYGDVQVFVHGEDAWPERDGLWVRGRTTAELTVVPASPRPLTLDVRAGARAVDVTLELGPHVRRATLTPGMSSSVTFPAGFEAQGLRVTTSDGFVPAEVEPGSRDRRLLGCWIAFR